jgi:hypothetical protein
MNPTAKGSQLLGCIGEVLCVGGCCAIIVELRFVLFVSSRRPLWNLKFLRAKKEAQEALLLDDEVK